MKWKASRSCTTYLRRWIFEVEGQQVLYHIPEEVDPLSERAAGPLQHT